MNTKAKAQAIASIILAAGAAGSAAFSDGIALEGGWLAAGVAILLSVLTGIGYVVPDNNPAPSSVRAMLNRGIIPKSQEGKLVQEGTASPVRR